VASTLLATLPHEIRRNIGAITLLADGLPDEAARQIVDEALRADRVVAALVDVARIVGGGATLRLEAVDPYAVVASALADVARDSGAVPVTVDLEPDLPLVIGHPVLVERVLVNLLTNAARHGAPPVVLEGRTVGGMVELGVRDAGPGIDRAWSDLSPAVAPVASPAGWLGVGLAISRLFAEEMRAELTLDTAASGSRLCLRLPAAP
jgi:signal transduction histidine kinase